VTNTLLGKRTVADCMQNNRRRCSIIQGRCVVCATDRRVPRAFAWAFGAGTLAKVPIRARLIRREESPISEEAAATAYPPVSAGVDRT
jgi:hypothetical protein